MIYLIISTGALFFVALFQGAKAKRWKRKGKRLLQTALTEQHKLMAKIEALESGSA